MFYMASVRLDRALNCPKFRNITRKMKEETVLISLNNDKLRHLDHSKNPFNSEALYNI
jgi:hypothetical protein